MPRSTAGIVLLITAIACWYGMMAVHESGHVIHAWVTGGTVQAVKLPLIGFSETAFFPNPRPHAVVWGGPVWGCLLPMLIDGMAWLFAKKIRHFTRAFAGFCLMANGAYIGLGWIDRIADAGDMMHYGTPVWVMIVFGVVTFAVGILYWHGNGAAFGLPKHKAATAGRRGCSANGQ